jgi:CDP-diacylglycerol---glycerol-3-phosphate 3-phosphatidyltransferase
MTEPPVPLVNVANVLTVARIVLVPIFLVFTLVSGMTDDGWRLAAAATFFVASLTDYVDGRVARSRNLVTSFGKVADPIADKALTGTALVLLSYFGTVPWWVTAVILVREWGVTGLRFWVLRYGVIAASKGGKVKTALQVAAITWYLCPFPHAVAWVADVIMAAAVIVTVVTGADYLWRALRMRRSATAPASPAPMGPSVAAAPVIPAVTSAGPDERAQLRSAPAPRVEQAPGASPPPPVDGAVA